jgi:hypothetical protein
VDEDRDWIATEQSVEIEQRAAAFARRAGASMVAAPGFIGKGGTPGAGRVWT